MVVTDFVTTDDQPMVLAMRLRQIHLLVVALEKKISLITIQHVKN